MRERPAGWYADPVTVGAARYWDGRGWTDYVAWGGAMRHDTTPLADLERAAAVADAIVIVEYLDDAERRGVLSSDVAARLRRDVTGRVPGRELARPERDAPRPEPAPLGRPAPVERPIPVARPDSVLRPPSAERPAPIAARTAEPASTASAASPAPATASATASTPTPALVPLPPPDLRPSAPVEPIPAEPGRLAGWWDDARRTVRSDLAIHGLAYLGVLLLFAGVTGLIVFSFGDVAPWLRVLAEFLVPGAMFLSAWFLRRRGAVFVAASLTALGGAVLPLIVAATPTDGAPFPPDAHGRALPIVQGALVLAVAVVMALAARRSESTPVRYLVAPVAWLAVGLAAAVLRDPVPTGADVARPTSLQLAVVLAAIMVTAVACRRSTGTALGRAVFRTALPAAAVVYTVELILAGDEGWPLAGTIVAGLAVVVLLEVLIGIRIRAIPPTPARLTTIASVLQFVVVSVTGLRLTAQFSPAWIALGAAVALGVLVEYVGARRPSTESSTVGLALTGLALCLTLAVELPTAIGFGALAFWGVWRHVRPPRWLLVQDRYGVVAAIGATVATVALWGLIPRGTAVVLTAGAVLFVALAGRWRPSIAADLLWRWFVPTAAVAVVLPTAGFGWGELPVEVAIASAMAALALAVTTLPVAVRVWLVAPVAIWSLANLGEAVSVARNAQAVALAALAAASVIVAILWARPACAHLAAIGHVTGIAALAAPTWPGWAPTIVVGLATLAWIVAAIADERGEAVHLAALRNAGTVPVVGVVDAGVEPAPDELAPGMVLIGLWGTVMLGLDTVERIALDVAWGAVATAGVGAGAALIVRMVRWRRAREVVLAWMTLVTGVLATTVSIASVGAERDHWAPVVALAVGLLVIAVTSAPRPLPFVWTGWVGSAVFTSFLADRCGLERDWADVLAAGWGAAALLGGLTVQRWRRGPLAFAGFVFHRLLLPPVVLGASAFVVGGLSGLGDGSRTEIGWTAAGMAVVVLAAALVLPLGALALPAALLGTAGYALLAPWDPVEHPWTFAPWAALALVAAQLTRSISARPTLASDRAIDADSTGGRRLLVGLLARWDMPSFVAAHCVAVVALIAAVDADEIAVTASLFALLAVVIAVVIRRWPWAIGGAALTLVAGVDAGHGWLALVLLVEGIAFTTAGLLRQARLERAVPVALGAVAVVGAWFDLATWLAWSIETVFYATVPGAAGVALVAAVALRTRRAPIELTAAWLLTGGLVSLAVGSGVADVGRLGGGLVLAGALAALALAAGSTAAVLGPAMRWLAVLLAAVALAPAVWALELSPASAGLIGTGIALAVLAAAALVRAWRPGSVWVFPSAGYALLVQLAALAVASAADDTTAAKIALSVISIELAIAARLVARPGLLLLSPAPVFVAWLVHAKDASVGDIGWWALMATMPIGAAVAVAAGAAIRWRRALVAPAASWAATGGAVVFGTAAMALEQVDRLAAGLVFAASLLMLALAAALASAAFGPVMRWLAAGLAALAWAPAAWGLDVSATAATLVGTGVALVVAIAVAVTHGHMPGAVWLHPAAIYAAVTQLAAAVGALSVLPDHGLVIVVLLASSVELVAAGVISGRSEVFVLTPVPACVAWLVFAADALTGEANWFTVPIGITVLVMTGVVRWIRRHRGGDPAAVDVVVLELVGMIFTVASALARTLAGELWYGVLALGVGTFLAAWGAITRVRWRAGFGAGAVALTIVVLISVPLSTSVTWRGPVLWLTLIAIGAIAIVVATMLESSRDRVRRLSRRLDEMTEGWERAPWGRDTA